MSRVSKVLDTVQFRKSLTDLIRGVRSSDNKSKYISQCVQEIRNEVKSKDKEVLTTAVKKSVYLHMLGYDMSWISFYIIRVLSHPKFTHRRIGYLAASQIFGENTEVAMLATNLIRKDFKSNSSGAVSIYGAGNALNCMSNICNPVLARDLAPDIITQLSSGRPYIRRRAILTLYKLFINYPEALRPAFPKLRDKLEDEDPSVVTAAVNVICELARLNARNYLTLAPLLFKMLSRNTDSWLLIKVVKLLSLLAPEEPRLAKKLVEPLCSLINTTNSMSLLYECIKACINGLSTYRNVMRLCCAKLRTFVDHNDLNLKYLGLLAMKQVMEVYPKGISEHRDLILACLDDEDVTIRLRALDLLSGMVNESNLGYIINKLKDHLIMADGNYQTTLVEKIVDLCSMNKYENVTDFEWYVTVLLDVTHIPTAKSGILVREQFLELSLRVNMIRPFIIRNMTLLIEDSYLRTENIEEGAMCEVLYAAAYLLGEYYEGDRVLLLLDNLFHHDVVLLPEHIQSIYMQSAIKLLTTASYQDPQIFEESLHIVNSRLHLFISSTHLEVQERAANVKQIIDLYFAIASGEIDETVLEPEVEQPTEEVEPTENKDEETDLEDGTYPENATEFVKKIIKSGFKLEFMTTLLEENDEIADDDMMLLLTILQQLMNPDGMIPVDSETWDECLNEDLKATFLDAVYSGEETLSLSSLEENIRELIGPVEEQIEENENSVEEQHEIAEESGNIFFELSQIFSEAFGPVSRKAQEMVPLPPGLDLDAWIFEPLPQPRALEESYDSYDDYKEKEYIVTPGQRAIRKDNALYLDSDSEDEIYKGPRNIAPLDELFDTGEKLVIDQGGRQNFPVRRTQQAKKRVKYEVQGDEMPEGAMPTTVVKKNTPREKSGLAGIDLTTDEVGVELVAETYAPQNNTSLKPRPPRGRGGPPSRGRGGPPSRGGPPRGRGGPPRGRGGPPPSRGRGAPVPFSDTGRGRGTPSTSRGRGTPTTNETGGGRGTPSI